LNNIFLRFVRRFSSFKTLWLGSKGFLRLFGEMCQSRSLAVCCCFFVLCEARANGKQLKTTQQKIVPLAAAYNPLDTQSLYGKVTDNRAEAEWSLTFLSLMLIARPMMCTQARLHRIGFPPHRERRTAFPTPNRAQKSETQKADTRTGKC
jgi:hypothetical protein